MGSALAPPARAQFAKRLRAIRAQRGFVRARHFAKTLGIEENRYTRYERAEVEPDLTLLRKMCETLRVTPDQLLGFAELDGDEHSYNSPGLAEAAADHGGRRGGSRVEAEDALAWRLATEVASVHRETKAKSKPVSDPLKRMRDTGSLYRHLQSDPFGTVAEILADPALEEIGAERKTALAELIEAYTHSVS